MLLSIERGKEMAKLTGPRVRGRKAGELRLEARKLVAAINASKRAQTVTVEIHPAEGKTKADTVDVEIPKGFALVPFELTRTKDDANVRETVKNGFADMDATCSISSLNAEDNAGNNWAIFLVSAK